MAGKHVGIGPILLVLLFELDESITFVCLIQVLIENIRKRGGSAWYVLDLQGNFGRIRLVMDRNIVRAGWGCHVDETADCLTL